MKRGGWPPLNTRCPRAPSTQTQEARYFKVGISPARIDLYSAMTLEMRVSASALSSSATGRSALAGFFRRRGFWFPDMARRVTADRGATTALQGRTQLAHVLLEPLRPFAWGWSAVPLVRPAPPTLLCQFKHCLARQRDPDVVFGNTLSQAVEVFDLDPGRLNSSPWFWRRASCLATQRPDHHKAIPSQQAVFNAWVSQR